jgi:hypothetical protein
MIYCDIFLYLGGEVYGLPEALRLDNGPELCSTALTA